jgi:ATP-dependent Lon protease
LFQLEKTFDDLNAENKNRESYLKQQLKEVEENLDKLKEGHFIKKEIDKPFYEKYLEKYTVEESKILQQLENCSNSISNPKTA